MIKRRVAIIAFYNDKYFLIQDRRKISKHGEDYGFFGGGIEPGETAEEALKREIKEELEIDLDNFELFKKDIFFIEEVQGEIERNVFIAQMPDLVNLKVNEGELKLISIDKLPYLKMVSGDLDLLKEIKRHLGK